MIKVIIAGGRDFDDYPKFGLVCDVILQDQSNIETVSGAKAPFEAYLHFQYLKKHLSHILNNLLSVKKGRTKGKVIIKIT